MRNAPYIEIMVFPPSETRTVKLPKTLPNKLWKEMLRFVVATKLSQGKEDLGNLFMKGPGQQRSPPSPLAT